MPTAWMISLLLSLALSGSGHLASDENAFGFPQYGTLQVQVLYKGRQPKPIKKAKVEIWNHATDTTSPFAFGDTNDDGEITFKQLKKDSSYQIWAYAPNGATQSLEAPTLDPPGNTPFRVFFEPNARP